MNKQSFRGSWWLIVLVAAQSKIDYLAYRALVTGLIWRCRRRSGLFSRRDWWCPHESGLTIELNLH